MPSVAGVGSIVGFTLVNANSNADIGPLSDGDIIDLLVDGSSLTIRAEFSTSSGNIINSVRFDLDINDVEGTYEKVPNFRTEEYVPYSLNGDSNPSDPNEDVDYYEVEQLGKAGYYNISATPFSADELNGVQGTTFTISFTIEPFPSGSPSTNPTVGPSIGPTIVPTTSPSEGPSWPPSGLPTTSPSVGPTIGPSVQPTTFPSEAPSSTPTGFPTGSPSSSPTGSPSTSPSSSPTIGATCNTQTGGISAPTDGNTVTIDVTNNDYNAKNLQSLEIIWPTDNGNLTAVTLDNKPLLGETAPCCSITLTSLPNNARKLEGCVTDSEPFVLYSENSDAEEDGYSVQATCTGSGGNCGTCISASPGFFDLLN